MLALVGLIAVYTQAGTFDMVAPRGVTASRTSFQMVWFPVIFLGFAALVPMWPLHSWSPAGHAAAPAAVSMLHAGVLMKLGRVRHPADRLRPTSPTAAIAYLPYVGLLCCMNIIYGGLVAMAQKRHEADHRLLVLEPHGLRAARHRVRHPRSGGSGAVFLMFAHGIMTALAFSLIGWFYDQTHTRMLDDLGGLMRSCPSSGRAS